MRTAAMAAAVMLGSLIVSGPAVAAQAQSGATAPSTASDATGPARGPGYGPGWGPGGMMGGYGGGYGYGPGPGMMGYGYGPGMGYGYGSGMMGGYGPGYGRGAGRGGAWGGGPFGALDLTPEQQEKIGKIHEDFRRNNWNAMGQLQSERYRLRQLYSAATLDAKALDEQQRKIDDLRRQMLKSRVEAHNQAMAALTPEQRKQMRSYGPWWMEQGTD